MAASADGKLYATGGGDKLVRLWNAFDGKPVRDLAGHGATVVRVDFRKDNLQLASADETGIYHANSITQAVRCSVHAGTREE